MVKKILTVYIVWLVTAVACCGPFEVEQYNIVGVVNRSVEGKFEGPNGRLFRFHDEELQDLDSVTSELMGIFIQWEEQFISHSGGSLLSAAVACSPPEPEALQTVKGILITSDSVFHDFGRDSQPGESLNEFFRFEYGQGTIEDDITQIRYFNERPLMLVSPVHVDQHHRFSVTIVLDNGTTISDKGPLLFLRRL